MVTHELSKIESQRALDLFAIQVSRELVGFIEDHQIPVRRHQLRLQLFATRQLIKTSNQQVAFLKRITRPGRFDHVSAEQIKMKIELRVEFLLPLLNKASRSNDQTTFEITPQHQLTDVQTRHDCLARARIVSKQKVQRLHWQHAPIDRFDLMR